MLIGYLDANWLIAIMSLKPQYPSFNHGGEQATATGRFYRKLLQNRCSVLFWFVVEWQIGEMAIAHRHLISHVRNPIDSRAGWSSACFFEAEKFSRSRPSRTTLQVCVISKLLDLGAVGRRSHNGRLLTFQFRPLSSTLDLVFQWVTNDLRLRLRPTSPSH